MNALRSAVVGKTWASEPITEMHLQESYFSELAAELSVCLQIGQEEEAANQNLEMDIYAPQLHSDHILQNTSFKPEVLWQSRYGNPRPKEITRHSFK